ncbi:addiction module protein [Pyxidicoccus fallax]|uniref:Addiction module protein n=1 Tax=Pyxidicoccus fallax TaxID=394095 RepID=A0A848LNQ4_9BACT|nr:addiction module protein [Pyxidicoccus fallax]NMO19331.1 addiction module protein [Pyxidicoccus fallax]NPC80023.1 addiction module protein [Pyxidicoccus fallax]
MASTADDLLPEALRLPTEERARLAHKLLLSLDDGEARTGADAEWAAEIERRAQEVVSGEVKTYDAREAIEEVRAQLRARRRG